MIKAEREARILSILAERGIISIRDLSARLGAVSSITVRRDVASLAERGVLRRTHGGAAAIVVPSAGPLADTAAPPLADIDGAIGDVDAMILSPIEGRGAETLRLLARRRHLPFLAESTPQAGGVYLGPDNFAAGRDLGLLAGRVLSGRIAKGRVLLVSLEALPNTRARCDGFLAGFAETFAGPVSHWRVDGQGNFRSSLRASLDALQAHPEINVAFGVNDHSILAALEASDRLDHHLHGFSVGGEGGALFDALRDGGKMIACAALFPEIVGQRGVDVLAEALAGEPMPAEVRTPHAVLTSDTLGRYYRHDEQGWTFAPESGVLEFGDGVAGRRPNANGSVKSIGFLPHYPAHGWYRNMARAMDRRCRELGLEFRLGTPRAGIAQEIRTLRRLIGRAAAGMISPGDTILINAGETSLFLAEELVAAQDITIVTNSLDVMERLSGRPGIKVILTSGEFQEKHRCLVGPSLGALFETLKVDKAFLSVDGISAGFGASSADERLALAARRFVNASRQLLVLADHSLVGNDANHRIARLDAVDDIITDSGSLPADRLAFASAGVRVTLADEEAAENETRLEARPDGRVLKKSVAGAASRL